MIYSLWCGLCGAALVAGCMLEELGWVLFEPASPLSITSDSSAHPSIAVLRPTYTRIMPGFDFSNHTRNAALHAKGFPLPKATSTGTTIVGCVFNGGVVIAAGIALLPFLKLLGTVD